jgi:hypothetical protein
MSEKNPMKLWTLRPNASPGRSEWGPWDPWYDKAFGFVIRAETEERARSLANERCGDEKKVWTDPALATCVELLPHGAEEEIMRDFWSA